MLLQGGGFTLAPSLCTPMLAASNSRKLFFNSSHLCSVDDVLTNSLDEVIRQGLLDPLVPYLTSSNSNTNVASVTNVNTNLNASVASNSNILNSTSGGQRTVVSVNVGAGTVEGSAAESSSKEEEERELSRAPSVNSLNMVCVSCQLFVYILKNDSC